MAATALLLICAPLVAQAQTVSAAAPSDAGMAGAAGRAEQLRLGLAGDTVAFAKGLAPVEQVALVDAVGPLDARSANDIAWFFRAADPVVAGDASMPIVSFYNPFADVVLVTTWRRIDSNWWLTSMVRLDGAVLRGRPGQPWWDEGDGAYAQSLQRQAAATLKAAAALSSDRIEALKEATMADFAAHLAIGERGLAAWAASAADLAAYDKVRAALAAASPDQIGLGSGHAPSASDLGAVAPDVRSSLAAVGAFRRADGVTLALASPLRPGLLLFVDFDAAPAPRNVTTVDLAPPAPSGGKA